MASFYSRYHSLFDNNLDVSTLKQHDIMLQRPLSLRMKDVEVQMKVFAKYSQGGNMISASKSQELMEQMRQYGVGRKAEQGQEKENARGEVSPGRARGRSHRHPEVENTGLMIGGSNSQPPSPRRMRAQVSGVLSSDLSKQNQLAALIPHPEPNEDYVSSFKAKKQVTNQELKERYTNLLGQQAQNYATQRGNRSNQMSEAGKALIHNSDKAAGLSAQEMEKLRDLSHNFAADHNSRRRWQQTIENERGGIFDRDENSNIKPIFIPVPQSNVNMELYSQYHRNKQKHQSHVMNNSPVAPTQIRNRSQDENEQKQSPVKVESLSKQDRMDLVSNKIPYIAPSQHAISNPYEMALKRRHGAKRALDKRN